MPVAAGAPERQHVEPGVPSAQRVRLGASSMHVQSPSRTS